eukprot:CAMPEP_0183517492 /NCGR_PEP_ID=MMETSP0371-20130417/14905_1 /TAXON_ID=268820 /ORGANISM="Peridinium aciculiferum, Strain PAER-2" /LENGTH=54 /DNA_ID=CAMNT_0025715387 /DNA_START=231 /DNA_END=395 /DNA_ORIENTATION=+
MRCRCVYSTLPLYEDMKLKSGKPWWLQKLCATMTAINEPVLSNKKFENMPKSDV